MSRSRQLIGALAIASSLIILTGPAVAASTRGATAAKTVVDQMNEPLPDKLTATQKACLAKGIAPLADKKGRDAAAEFFGVVYDCKAFEVLGLLELTARKQTLTKAGVVCFSNAIQRTGRVAFVQAIQLGSSDKRVKRLRDSWTKECPKVK